MGNIRKRATGVAAAAVVAVSLAGCGGGSTSDNNNAGGPAKAGGTLHFLQYSPSEHLDPQRMYIGRDLSNFGRTVYRSLVTFPTSTDVDTANTPVPDLATDTGTPNADSTEWKFTIKDGVKWQDGKAITCEDFKYGISRTFATDVITGGPNYALNFLDVPTDAKTGLPAYDGPYKKDHQADFDKAVTCDGNTITYRFNKPFPDFPLAIASLRAYDPYRADQDKGDKSNLTIFSNGPYMLKGSWDLNKGGVLVRNPEWDKSTDDIRKANPDEIDFEIGLTPETIYDRLIADNGDDANAITTNSIPPSYYSQIEGPIKDRSVNIESPYVNYVLPNFNRLKNAKVREALAAATDRKAYSAAIGGANASTPAQSMVNPTLLGYQPNPSFPDANGGDVATAKKLLQESGEKLPYAIKYTYPGGTPTSDKTAAALKATWDAAGFKTTLDPLTDTYYDVIQKPTSSSDVIWGGWGADWPSIATVLPALFDSRVNLTPDSNGQDYGNYKSDAANALIDEAAQQTDVTKQADIYAKLDAQLGKDTAYIPLDITKFYYLHGSNVDNYVNSVSTSGYPDLAVISLKS